MKNKKHIILYASVLAILIFILKWLQWKFLIVDNSIDIYIGLIAIFFTCLGIWVASQLTSPKIKEVIIEKEVIVPFDKNFSINEIELEKLNLTKREYEILQQISKGKSNAEIADALYLSISTVKTHVSNLLKKMNVSSRSQAIAKSKKLSLIE